MYVKNERKTHKFRFNKYSLYYRAIAVHAALPTLPINLPTYLYLPATFTSLPYEHTPLLADIFVLYSRARLMNCNRKTLFFFFHRRVSYRTSYICEYTRDTVSRLVDCHFIRGNADLCLLFAQQSPRIPSAKTELNCWRRRCS